MSLGFGRSVKKRYKSLERGIRQGNATPENSSKKCFETDRYNVCNKNGENANAETLISYFQNHKNDMKNVRSSDIPRGVLCEDYYMKTGFTKENCVQAQERETQSPSLKYVLTEEGKDILNKVGMGSWKASTVKLIAVSKFGGLCNISGEFEVDVEDDSYYSSVLEY